MPRIAANADGQMRLLDVFGEKPQLRRPLHDRNRRKSRHPARLGVRKMIGNVRHALGVVAVTSDGNDGVDWHVVTRFEIEECHAMHPVERFRRSGECTAKGVAGPERLREQFLDVMIGLVPVHQQLFLDNLAFLGDVGAGQFGMPVHIAKHVEQQIKVLLAGFGVIAGAFLAGKSVEVTANTFNRLADLLGRTACRAFKEQMFNEMGDAGEWSRLMPTANANPHAD